jgi:hypothetical protein
MWFDMESNRPLSSAGLRAGRALEIPPGARIVIVHEGSRETTPETAAVATEAATATGKN